MKNNKGYIAISQRDKDLFIKEEFTGEINDDLITYPKELGAKHPFDFKLMDDVYIKIGFVSGTVNKIKDSIIGDFSIKVKNRNAQAIIDSFIKNADFLVCMESWVKEGVLKGNAFIEVDLNEEKIRVMNANSMYVKRNNKGKVLMFNQYLGDLTNRFNSNKIISFKPEQIAHLTLNKIPNDPYGIGYIYPTMKTINTLTGIETDHVKLISRKAGFPYHFKVGQPGDNTQTEVIDAIKTSVTYLTNRTEWVTDGNVDIKALDFKDVGENLTAAYMHYFRMYLAGVEVPEVLMGSGQLNEGIAKVQLEGFNRKIKSIRLQIEDVIEKKILRPLLKKNGLDESITFKWETLGTEEVNEKLRLIKDMLSTSTITSPILRAQLEIEYANLMGFEELVKVLPTPTDVKKKQEEFEKKLNDIDKERSTERKQEEEIPQPEVPGAKPAANEALNNSTLICSAHKEIKETDHEQMSIREFVNIKELAGFNYNDYLIHILKILRTEKFEQLSAITEEDVMNGLLPKKDIDKLRIILKEGFKENKTIREIEGDVKLNIELKDRIKDGKIITAANNRPNSIVRTETVRIANEGLINLYKENKIEKIRFLAALSDRTCVSCEELNGKIYNINESQGIIPVHTSCRCSWLSIVE